MERLSPQIFLHRSGLGITQKPVGTFFCRQQIFHVFPGLTVALIELLFFRKECGVFLFQGVDKRKFFQAFAVTGLPVTESTAHGK